MNNEWFLRLIEICSKAYRNAVISADKMEQKGCKQMEWIVSGKTIAKETLSADLEPSAYIGIKSLYCSLCSLRDCY